MLFMNVVPPFVKNVKVNFSPRFSRRDCTRKPPPTIAVFGSVCKKYTLYCKYDTNSKNIGRQRLALFYGIISILSSLKHPSKHESYLFLMQV